MAYPQEYWRKNILFAIESSVGTPICTDSISCKPLMERSFGHFARVLVDFDLSEHLRYGVIMERKGYEFFVGFEYENLLDFCSYCNNIGHYVDNCRKRKMNNSETEVEVQPKAKVNAVQNKVFVEKKKIPEVDRIPVVVPTVSPSKTVNSVRSQEDIDLENEINVELQNMNDENPEGSNRAQVSDARQEDSLSLTESEFVDATQNHIEGIEKVIPDKRVTTPEAVLKDVDFSKDAWANLDDLDENDFDNSPSLDCGENSITKSRPATSLTRVQTVNQEADSANPSSEDHDFQLETTRAKKNAEKAKIAKKGGCTTKSKVGNSKPFK